MEESKASLSQSRIPAELLGCDWSTIYTIHVIKRMMEDEMIHLKLWINDVVPLSEIDKG